MYATTLETAHGIPRELTAHILARAAGQVLVLTVFQQEGKPLIINFKSAQPNQHNGTLSESRERSETDRICGIFCSERLARGRGALSGHARRESGK